MNGGRIVFRASVLLLLTNLLVLMNPVTGLSSSLLSKFLSNESGKDSFQKKQDDDVHTTITTTTGGGGGDVTPQAPLLVRFYLLMRKLEQKKGNFASRFTGSGGEGVTQYSFANLFYSRQKRQANTGPIDKIQAEKEGNKHDSTDDDEAKVQTTFDESSDWPQKYRHCNPQKNRHTSPVDISTADISQVKGVQTLLVYAEPPRPETYVFSTVFHSDDGAILEGFNIRLKGVEVLREAAHISGLGTRDHRFFDSALFFLRPEDSSNLPSIRRAHTIDKKDFPMEIMFTFKTSMGEDVTQIHVMVEIGEEENPIWRPIVTMMEPLVQNVIQEKCFGAEMLQKHRQELHWASTDLHVQLNKQQNETDGSTFQELYTELLDAYEVALEAPVELILELNKTHETSLEKAVQCQKLVRESTQTVTVLQPEVKDLSKKLRLAMAELNALQTSLIELVKSINESVNSTTQPPSQRRYKRKPLLEVAEPPKNNSDKGAIRIPDELAINVTEVDDKIELILEEIKNMTEKLNSTKLLLTAANATLAASKKCLEEDGKLAQLTEKEITRLMKLRAYYRIGTGPNDLYPSAAAVKEKLDYAKNNLEKLDLFKLAYENARFQYETLLASRERSIILTDPFHISWFFPARGGHYFYNGSSPIPPCNRRPHVIVFEDRITISKEQLNSFYQFPSTKQKGRNRWSTLCTNEYDTPDKKNLYVEGMDKMTNLVPETTPLGARTVWYNPRNLQYKGDDGVHMLSRRRRLRKWQPSGSKKGR